MIQTTFNVPALLAEHPAPNVSDRYNYISTRDIHDIMGSLGWDARVGHTVNSKTADPLYRKHLIRYTRPEWGNQTEYPEIYWINSHDGSCALTARAGIFRLVCTNGTTIMTEDYGSLRIRHDNPVAENRFDILDLVMDYTLKVRKVMDTVLDWKLIQVPLEQRIDFYRKASQLRSKGMTELELITFDVPQRQEDSSHDLWTMFNRTQEYLVRGGYSATSAATNKPRNVREISSINSLEKVNSDLYGMANEIAIAS